VFFWENWFGSVEKEVALSNSSKLDVINSEKKVFEPTLIENLTDI
jgi:hypothetical protein